MYKWINSTLQVRENNASLVRSVLRSVESATKADLSARTRLSVATCGKILSGMMESGEVHELDLAVSAGGRPARLYSYNAAHSLTALLFPKVVDGGPYIIHEVRDARHAVVEKGGAAVPRADARAIGRLLDALTERHPAVGAAALSIPGLVRNGVVGFCDLPELEGVDIVRAVGKKRGFPVKADNDMNLAALGYYHAMMGKGSLVYMVVPERNCTGAGIVVDGKLISGRSCFAGELSFIPHGISRERQFAGLGDDEAIRYSTDLIATVIAVINPTVLVLASSLATREVMRRVRGFCGGCIPREHLPEFVARREMDEDCMVGLGLLAETDVDQFSLPAPLDVR